MDPLSFTASLLTVIQATRIGIKGMHRFSAYRKAPKELQQFMAELEDPEVLLESVRTFIERNPSMAYCGILSTPVAFASGRLHSVNQILASRTFRLSCLSEENKARLTWVRYRHRLAALTEDIKSLKVELGLRLGLFTA